MPVEGQEVQGSEKTYPNGAVSHMLWHKKLNGDWGKQSRFTKGAPKEYLDKIRGAPSKRTTEKKATKTRKPLSEAQKAALAKGRAALKAKREKNSL